MSDLDEGLPNIWSCEDRYSKCRNPYGCHCAEITNQHYAIEQLRDEVARLTIERDLLVSEKGFAGYGFVTYKDHCEAVAREKARTEAAETSLAKAQVFIDSLCEQKLIDEMSDEEIENGDTTDAYEYIVKDARRLRASLTGGGSEMKPRIMTEAERKEIAEIERRKKAEFEKVAAKLFGTARAKHPRFEG